MLHCHDISDRIHKYDGSRARIWLSSYSSHVRISSIVIVIISVYDIEDIHIMSVYIFIDFHNMLEVSFYINFILKKFRFKLAHIHYRPEVFIYLCTYLNMQSNDVKNGEWVYLYAYSCHVLGESRYMIVYPRYRYFCLS